MPDNFEKSKLFEKFIFAGSELTAAQRSFS
jgi:hypothetical protein